MSTEGQDIINEIGARCEASILKAENELAIELFGDNVIKAEFLRGSVYALRRFKFIIKEVEEGKLDYIACLAREGSK